MGIQDDLQSLKTLKPYHPNFDFHCNKLQLDLEYGLGNGEITLAQYKQFSEEIKKTKILPPSLVYVDMAPIMKKNFEFFCNVEKLGNLRNYLDSRYGTLKTLAKDNGTFLKEVTDELLESVKAKDKEKTFDLFYFYNCYVRCHDIAELTEMGEKGVTVVSNTYHYVMRELIAEMANSGVKELQAFGDLGNFKLDANVIATVIRHILSDEDENTINDLISKIIKQYYSKSKMDACRILDILAKYVHFYFSQENDYAEIFKMVDVIIKYSDYSVSDVIGDRLVSKLKTYIYKYFENFEDFDCYNFIVRNQMYFSNASNRETIKTTKDKLRELLRECSLLDYDGILN